MSVGSHSSEYDQSSSPNSKNYAVRRPHNPFAHSRTSYKLTKPKPSKVKEFTKSEIIGISLSIFLSITFSVLLVYVVQKGSPILLTNLTRLINEIMGNDVKPHQSQPHNSGNGVKTANFLKQKFNLTKTDFNAKFMHKFPLLFTLPGRSQTQRELYHLIENQYASLSIPLRHINKLENSFTYAPSDATDVLLSTILQSEVSLDSQILSGEEPNPHHLFASNSQILNSMPLVSELLNAVLKESPAEVGYGTDSSLLVTPHSLFRIFSDQDHRVLSIGRNDSAALSGTSFHMHGQSVNELLRGRKHWVMYRPSKLPLAGFNPAQNLATWLKTVYPTLPAEEMPAVELIQEEGQLVYVPEGWYHATRTLTDVSVSVSHWSAAVNKGHFLYFLNEGIAKFNEGDFIGANKMYKLGLALCRDHTLLHNLARSLEKSQHYLEAEEVYQEVLGKNPRNPEAYVDLITLLISKGSNSRKDSSDEVSQLLDRAEQFGLRDTVLEMTQKGF